MDIDLYGFRSRWPSITRRGNAPAPAADPARLTTLDGVFGAQMTRRADPARVRDLLSQLIESIEGKPLSDFVPMAQTVPLLLGLTPQNLLAFDEFLAEFIGTIIGDLGRVVDPPSVTSPSDSISANRRRLGASALGIRRTTVQPGLPPSRRKFDELTALFSQGTVLAAVLGNGDHGLPPGVSGVVNGMLVAVRHGLTAGSAKGAREAGKGAAILVAAAHVSFLSGETSERGARCNRLQPVARTHTAGLSGMVRVRKSPADTSRARIVAVEMEGVEYEVDQRTGKHRRKGKRR